MAYNAANPLIVQSDKSLLLEVNNDHYEEARNWLARFAELIIYDKAHLLPAPERLPTPAL